MTERFRFRADEIIDASVKIVQCSRADIIGTGRTLAIIMARRIATAALRELKYPQPSFPEIAACLGRKHHSSCWTAYKQWRLMHPAIRQSYLDAIVSDIQAQRKKRAKLHPI